MSVNVKLSIPFILYLIASFFSIGNLFAIVLMHWNFIISGKGLGSFTILWFIGYFILSVVLWGIAFLMERNWQWTIVFWISVLVPILLFTFLPVRFYIE